MSIRLKAPLPLLAAGALPAVLVSACASPPPKAATLPTPAGAVVDPPTPAAVEDAPPPPPATLKEAAARFASECPVPFFTLATNETLSIGGQAFVASGSTLTLTPAAEGTVVIGVVGAVKDAEPETRENLVKAAASFATAGVQLVLVNGDVVGHETAALSPVTTMLDEVFAVPVVVHSGNYEWTSAFTETVATHEGLINGNLVREIDLGAVHLLTLPGYFNRRFLQPGACHHDDDDVAAVAERAKAIAAAGGRVVLSSHGPPLQKEKASLDVTSDGEHVGDPALTALLRDAGIGVGLFGHILESGGRVVADVDGTVPLRLPTKGRRVVKSPTAYVNVGSASSFGWGMNDGSTARGMAAIVTVEASATAVEFITLR